MVYGQMYIYKTSQRVLFYIQIAYSNDFYDNFPQKTLIIVLKYQMLVLGAYSLSEDDLRVRTSV